MSNPVQAGQAAISITLDDDVLRTKLAQAERSIQSLGQSGDLPVTREIGELGKAISLFDNQLGGSFGKWGRGLAPVLNGLKEIQATIVGTSASASGLGGALAKMSVPQLALGAGAFIGGYEIGEALAKWISGYKEFDYEANKATNYAEDYRNAMDSQAKTMEVQIERLKQFASAQELSNEQQAKALELAKSLNVEASIKNNRLVLPKGVPQVEDEALALRIKGQEAVVAETKANIDKLRKTITALSEEYHFAARAIDFLNYGSESPLAKGVSNNFRHMPGGDVALDNLPGFNRNDPVWQEIQKRLGNNPEGNKTLEALSDWLASDSMEKMKQAEQELEQATKKLGDEQRKLLDLQGVAGPETLKKLAAEEKKLIEARNKQIETIEKELNKLNQDVETVGMNPVERQRYALAQREKDTITTLEKNGATDEQINQARENFTRLFDAIDEGLKKTIAEEEKARKQQIDKMKHDAERQAQLHEEATNLAVERAKDGSQGYDAKLGEYMDGYAESIEQARRSMAQLSLQMSGLKDPTTDEYKALSEKYKKTFEEFSENTARYNELLRMRNEVAQQELVRAAEYHKANKDVYDKQDANRQVGLAQKSLDREISAATAAGDVQALEELADAARHAADAAEQAEIAKYHEALADERLTAEEEKLLTEMQNHAQAMREQAYQLEDAVEEAKRSANQKGMGGAGGFDASTAIARAMAQAMRQDKSVEYQRDTAKATKELVELEKKRRDTILAFN